MVEAAGSRTAAYFLGGGAEQPIQGRGLAAGDYDDDGRVDALAMDSDGEPVLMRNVTHGAEFWLAVRLVGREATGTATAPC